MLLCCRTIWLLLVVRTIVVDDLWYTSFPSLLRSRLDSERRKCFELSLCNDACDSRFQVYHSELCLDTCNYGCVYGRREIVFLAAVFARYPCKSVQIRAYPCLSVYIRVHPCTSVHIRLEGPKFMLCICLLQVSCVVPAATTLCVLLLISAVDTTR